MVLEDEASGMQNPVRFGLSKIIQKDGRETFVGKSGTDVEIPIPPGVEPTIGSNLYRISRHDLHVPEINESSLQPFRYAYVLTITIGTDTLHVQARGLPTWIPVGIGHSYALDIQLAKSPQQLQQNLEKVFSSPGEGLVTTASVELINESGLVDTQLFMPLSQLKEIRRNWYEYLNAEINRHIDARIPMKISTPISLPMLPARNMISPLSDPAIPWADPEKVLRQLQSGIRVERLLASIDDQIYLPLPPVMFGEQAMFDALDALIDHIGKNIVVGLNNIGQLPWARKHPGIPCFADIYLYMTNRRSAQLFVESIPKVGGMYSWIEREYLDTTDWPCNPSQVGKDFSIPLFISRNCYRYDTLKLPCEGCPRSGSWHIKQNGKPYRVDVRNCVTIVSEQPEE
jgi:putative protease